MSLRDLLQYVNVNSDSLPNYGKRYRAGQPIWPAWVESTVNEVIAKRMVKKRLIKSSVPGTKTSGHPLRREHPEPFNSLMLKDTASGTSKP